MRSVKVMVRLMRLTVATLLAREEGSSTDFMAAPAQAPQIYIFFTGGWCALRLVFKTSVIAARWSELIDGLTYAAPLPGTLNHINALRKATGAGADYVTQHFVSSLLELADGKVPPAKLALMRAGEDGKSCGLMP